MGHFKRARFGLDKFVLIGNRKIHYAEVGQGDPVILIPGSGSTHRAWTRLMPLLAQDYRLLSLDFLLDQSTAKNQASDLEDIHKCSEIISAIIKQLNLGKVKLIGWGFGGAVAFDLAARFADNIEKVITLSWYFCDTGEAKSVSKLKWKKWGLKRHSRSDLIEQFRNIKQPVLYLYGAGQANQSYISNNLQYLQTNLPQTWIIGLEGGIFELLMKNPQEVASLIIKFLRTKISSS